MIGTLMRLTFWGGLVLFFIPLDTPEQADGRQVTAFEAIIAARETVQDMRGICMRKPDVCEIGGAAVETITARARAGARLVLSSVADAPEAGEAATDMTTTGSTALPAARQRGDAPAG